MEIIKIENHDQWLRLRSEDITSTDVSALFGMSPYLTPFELWHRKKSKVIPEFEQTERIRWGNRLEEAIANGIANDNHFQLSPMKDYIRIPELRIGSSFDFSIDQCPEYKDKGILEIKNVDSLVFKNDWGEEAPPHIEIQVQHQMLVSGRSYAYIGALVGGNTVHLIKREADQDIINNIKHRVKMFWESIEKNNPPNPDYSRDSEYLKQLYSYAEPNKIMAADSYLTNIALTYKQLKDQDKILQQKIEECRAKMLERIGDAEKIIGDNFTISAGMIGPTQINYERKGYRNFKINWKGMR